MFRLSQSVRIDFLLQQPNTQFLTKSLTFKACLQVDTMFFSTVFTRHSYFCVFALHRRITQMSFWRHHLKNRDFTPLFFQITTNTRQIFQDTTQLSVKRLTEISENTNTGTLIRVRYVANRETFESDAILPREQFSFFFLFFCCIIFKRRKVTKQLLLR